MCIIVRLISAGISSVRFRFGIENVLLSPLWKAHSSIFQRFLRDICTRSDDGGETKTEANLLILTLIPYCPALIHAALCKEGNQRFMFQTILGLQDPRKHIFKSIAQLKDETVIPFAPFTSCIKLVYVTHIWTLPVALLFIGSFLFQWTQTQ